MPAASSAPPLALAWNPTRRLWGRASSGHTPPTADLGEVHSGVESAVKLLGLVQLGGIEGEPLADAVEGLLTLQVTAGPRRGCFRWYAEESEPVDTNASFFIGLALQLLALDRSVVLPPALCSRLQDAFGQLNHWLLREIAQESPIYPNKYLGDLVCAWLGHEALDTPPPGQLEAAFRQALTFWETHHWGWGEHQSDVYAGVLLTELSALLLFARRLPADLREHAHRLTVELLALDDAYGAGPRVPQIRAYHFAGAPARIPFREQVTPWPDGADEAWVDARALQRYMLLPFGPLFHARGWTTLFPASPPVTGARELDIALAGGARARAWVAPHLRTGVLSRWPLVPDTEHQRWGLSWQTFPAALWRPAGDWGFLRFTTRRGDDMRAHPALDKARAYLANALGPGQPPPLGHTRGAQHGPHWITLRTPPGLSAKQPAWDEVTDGFWFPRLSVTPRVHQAGVRWNLLHLDYADGPVWLHHFSLASNAPPTLAGDAAIGWRWVVSHGGPAAAPPSPQLWALTVGPEPAVPPAIDHDAASVRVRWPAQGWPDLHLPVDPPAPATAEIFPEPRQ